MSGSNSICVATVLLETGLVEMTEPITRFSIEAPGGLVAIEAQCRAGKAERITITNVASFASVLDAEIDVAGIGKLRVDTAFGGDSFVLVDADDLGIDVDPANASRLVAVGGEIVRAANEQLGFVHPTNSDWTHISFCQIAEPLSSDRHGRLTMRSTSVIEPGKLDRSPTGTGVSARMAVLHQRGQMGVGDELVMRSVIDSEFVGSIAGTARAGDLAAIVPTVSGRAWITGVSSLVVDPADPWPTGYRVGDTWPTG